MKIYSTVLFYYFFLNFTLGTNKNELKEEAEALLNNEWSYDNKLTFNDSSFSQRENLRVTIPHVDSLNKEELEEKQTDSSEVTDTQVLIAHRTSVNGNKVCDISQGLSTTNMIESEHNKIPKSESGRLGLFNLKETVLGKLSKTSSKSNLHSNKTRGLNLKDILHWGSSHDSTLAHTDEISEKLLVASKEKKPVEGINNQTFSEVCDSSKKMKPVVYNAYIGFSKIQWKGTPNLFFADIIKEDVEVDKKKNDTNNNNGRNLLMKLKKKNSQLGTLKNYSRKIEEYITGNNIKYFTLNVTLLILSLFVLALIYMLRIGLFECYEKQDFKNCTFSILSEDDTN